MNQQQQHLSYAQQIVPPINPIDPALIVEHGESPTSIILAVCILITILLSFMTGLVHIVAVLILQQAKSSR